MSEDKGFTVKDKRHFTEEGEAAPEQKDAEEKAAPEAEKAAPEAEKAGEKAPPKEETAKEHALPEVNFATFVVSLSSSVLVHLGDMPDPHSGQAEKNLPLAKQTIDILAMLDEKTKGNLMPDEANLLKNVLYDLRMRYVKLTRG